MARRPDKIPVSKELSVEIRRKLKALEEVAGLLNDLSPEELKAFWEAAKRRPLFGDRPYARLSAGHEHPHRAPKK